VVAFAAGFSILRMKFIAIAIGFDCLLIAYWFYWLEYLHFAFNFY